jgi:integrase
MPSTLTLKEALAEAMAGRWGSLRGAHTLEKQARRCVRLLGEDLKVSQMDAKRADLLLARLVGCALTEKSRRDYYGAFRRLMELTGVDTRQWPKPMGSLPRKTREAMRLEEFTALVEELRKNGATDTANLAVILRGAGLRVDVEGLTSEALAYEAADVDRPYGLLHVTGKGGHERLIPIVDPDAQAILGAPNTLRAIQARPYWSHLRLWNRAASAVGIPRRRATPHAVRHMYATSVHERSGGNLVMVQELLGHADIKTTARYVTVKLGDKVAALTEDEA